MDKQDRVQRGLCPARYFLGFYQYLPEFDPVKF